MRIYGINKENGLWYDELLTYSFACEAFPLGIIDAVAQNEFQGVFHYLYMGLWMVLFGESDLALRFSSVVFGVLLIPVVYFLGKELHSRGLGLFSALMVSFSPVLIYYSQEVRPYSLLALLGTLSFLFLLRLEKGQNLLNYLFLVIFNVLILYTYTIGFVFVFLQAFIYLIYLKKTDNKSLKNFIYAQLAILILYLPYMFSVINNFSYYLNSVLIDPFFYSDFNKFTVLITLQDWFTPMLTGIYQHDGRLYTDIFFSNSGLIVFLFILVVVGVFLFGLFRALSKFNSGVYIVFLTCSGFLLFVVAAAVSGNFCLVTRHTLLVFPAVLCLCCLGIYTIQNKKLVILLIFPVIGFYFYNFISEYSVSRWERAGIKPVVGYLTKYNLEKTDFVVVPCFSEFAEKYFSSVKTLKINYMKAFFLDKSGNSLERLIKDPDLILKTAKNNDLSSLRQLLMSDFALQSIKKIVFDAVTGLKTSEYFVVIRKTDYAAFSEKELEGILAHNERYNNAPVFKLLASKIVNSLLKEAGSRLKLIEKRQIAPIWEVYIFQKT